MSENPPEERPFRVAEHTEHRNVAIENHRVFDQTSREHDELLRLHGGRRHGRFVVIDGSSADPTETLLARSEECLRFHRDVDAGDENDGPSKLAESFECDGDDMGMADNDDPRGSA